MAYEYRQEDLFRIKSNRERLEEMLESMREDLRKRAIMDAVQALVAKIAASREEFMVHDVETAWHAIYGECPRVGKHGRIKKHQPECRWPVKSAGGIMNKKFYRPVGNGPSPSNNNPWTTVWTKR